MNLPTPVPPPPPVIRRPPPDLSLPRDAALLGLSRTTGDPVLLANAGRPQGAYLIGKPGQGKSVVMEHIAISDLRQGFGLCALDPHGDFITHLLWRLPEKREKDVILLNPLDLDFPFGLNLYDCPDPGNQIALERTVDQAMHIFRKLWGEGGVKGTSWGPQMEDLLANAARTLALVPGAAMTELPWLLTNTAFRERLLADLPEDEEDLRWFWEVEYPTSERDQRDYRASTLNKVRPFVLRQTIRNIVGQARSTVDFRRFMDEGKIVLVPLSAGLLGAEVAALLGSLIVGQILTAALSRQALPEGQRLPFALVADEVQHFATDDFAQLIEQCRKYNVLPVVAHQHLGQLPERLRETMVAMGTLIVFGVTGRSAAELAIEFSNRPPPGELTFEPVMDPAGVPGLVTPAKDYRYEFRGYGIAPERFETTYYEAKPGPQRLYSDMLAERADTLTNLPPYTAQVKRRHGNRVVEDLVWTLPSPCEGEMPPELVARIERIVARTREQYCRPRQLVEEEIRTRRRIGEDPRDHGGVQGAAGAATPSRTGRRGAPPKPRPLR